MHSTRRRSNACAVTQAQERRGDGAEIVREAVDAFLARYADYAIALDSPGDPTDAAVDAEPLWRKIECPGD